MDHNRNPAGRNQYAACPPASDPVLAEALRTYHRELLSSNNKIARRLKADHGIEMHPNTVKKRRKELGLSSSGKTAKTLSMGTAEQLVARELEDDPHQRLGIRTVQHRIAFNSGVHVRRDSVSEIMHTHVPEGFEKRMPTTTKILRHPKHPIGIHERWSADGHDKLYSIGFPVWAVVDDATSKWLGAWIVPSNRLGVIIAYCFLDVVEKFQGLPLQFTTDCGSETTKVYGLVNALRENYHPEYQGLAPHVYLRSVHNITIERSWLRLRLDWGDTAVYFFNKGIEEGRYDDQDPDQHELCQWLWSKLLRQELQHVVDMRNSQRMRKDRTKFGPSGMSRNEAFSLPQDWGGRNCLLPIDVNIIRDLKQELGGDQLLDFTSAEFSARAQVAYDSLQITKLTFQNAWDVFNAMLPLVFGERQWP
ncbi:hypothetical protein EWM64_g8088 [Hericium alpestre]|uniref:Integrase core domain-containing protein n=1 Tax=Hericium alpestre TaxID=135208 RepID=A0A4Y9ZM38_9AGAM|nr:hypothetical protein EWM64_g8088 [Hericium alpestre]